MEGDAGAPLELEEVDELEENYQAYAPYMPAQGRREVERQGFMIVDSDGDYTTPLVNNAECAYAFEEHGITFCAIERAYREGKCSFLKPLSCHLYPIRVMKFSNGTYGLNYHRWGVCHDAVECGRKIGLPIYKALKAPVIRRFGEEFYHALECAEELIKDQENK